VVLDECGYVGGIHAKTDGDESYTRREPEMFRHADLLDADLADAAGIDTNIIDAFFADEDGPGSL
jgi:hypothetical protein